MLELPTYNETQNRKRYNDIFFLSTCLRDFCMVLKPLNILHIFALPKSYYTSILIFSTNDFDDFIQDLFILLDFNAMSNLPNKVVFSF